LFADATFTEQVVKIQKQYGAVAFPSHRALSPVDQTPRLKHKDWSPPRVLLYITQPNR